MADAEQLVSHECETHCPMCKRYVKFVMPTSPPLSRSEAQTLVFGTNLHAVDPKLWKRLRESLDVRPRL